MRRKNNGAWSFLRYKCGHETREYVSGTPSERWNYSKKCMTELLCPDCCAKAEREEKQALWYDITTEASDESPLTPESICLFFSGNTYPSKEAIKASGYKWETYTPAGNARRWQKTYRTEDPADTATILRVELNSIQKAFPNVRIRANGTESSWDDVLNIGAPETALA